MLRAWNATLCSVGRESEEVQVLFNLFPAGRNRQSLTPKKSGRGFWPPTALSFSPSASPRPTRRPVAT
jgi:hypothetical protein